MINFGKRLFASVKNLNPGDLIQFGYNGKVRTGVVISPDWKDNVDCYVFDQLQDTQELLEHIVQSSDVFEEGHLYVDFGNTFDFKSFKQDKMTAIQQIEYIFIEEEKETKEDIEELDTKEPMVELVETFKKATVSNLYGEE